jgi:very-short-patch-repair endonuclease
MTQAKMKEISAKTDKENKQRKADNKKKRDEDIRKTFNSLLRSLKLPEATTEFRFHPTRMWRFDYCWPEHKIALEVEGGIFTRGAHVRPTHFLSDIEKYNTAVSMGWRIVRTIPDHLMSKGTVDLIHQLYITKPKF